MSNIYLVRHGQAGTREAYDSLSGLGQLQVNLLGEYFARQQVEFQMVYCGTMNRQQHTATAIREAYKNTEIVFPEIRIEGEWNEFDLNHIYHELGPKLCAVDEAFRVEYEEMRIEVRQNFGVSEAKVHRQWRPCDTKIVETWISGCLEYSGETWEQFRDRVRGCSSKLNSIDHRANILICTSATPTAVLTGLALDITDSTVRQLAGVLYNSAYTKLRLRDGKLVLMQFNAVPHLQDPELRTHR